ncbi:hypothetical protein H5P28_01540 [Ruficoccus amylovorans]|uniref:Glycoside hydrolase family 2 catalytic domain-containing protein n=1 Tax=Ruficoccus amylovorans TaxID=1804625 RepID=A0A842H8S9_9BACT|nr:glycoside hydrolase family 2 TIM barrel-domain containing protein [Ruficoccus amylovorans]MBC2592933.1 hypothetical protein [Ruficoccus amylovorans]
MMTWFYKTVPLASLNLLCLGACGNNSTESTTANAAPEEPEQVWVEIVQDTDGNYSLTRNGEPYQIKGAGGPSRYEKLAEEGGNTTRTWGINQLYPRDDNGKNLLDRAHEAGIAVVAGIWVQQLRSGFDYTDQASLEKQRELIRQGVRDFRDHPAILMWGLGNEIAITTPGDNDAMWKELNVLAEIVKEEDPFRPVMTVIAGAHEGRIKGLLANTPAIDVLGVNAYGGGSNVPERLQRFGWTKPYVLSEYGPRGHWEVRKTQWGAPIEPSPIDKARLYLDTYQALEENGGGNYLGSFAFLWGDRQEVTPTWFSMFLSTGEKTPAVDYMSYAWTGEWPEELAPWVEDWTVPFAEKKVKAGEVFTVEAKVHADHADTLECEWWVLPEKKGPSVGGDPEKWLTPIEGVIMASDGPTATVRMPEKPGAYRLYLKLSNGKGGASVQNTPFYVEE